MTGQIYSFVQLPNDYPKKKLEIIPVFFANYERKWLDTCKFVQQNFNG